MVPEIVTRLSDTSQTSSSLKKKEVIEDPGLGGFVKQWLSESQEEEGGYEPYKTGGKCLPTQPF